MTVNTSLSHGAERHNEGEDSGGPSRDMLVATIEGLEAQLHSLYEERSTSSYLATEISMENLEAQLRDVYAEREALA